MKLSVVRLIQKRSGGGGGRVCLNSGGQNGRLWPFVIYFTLQVSVCVYVCVCEKQEEMKKEKEGGEEEEKKDRERYVERVLKYL